MDTAYPKAQYDPYRPTSYAYVFTRETGEAVEVLLKKNFLPPVFYEYLKKGRDESFTPEEYILNEQLKQELGNRALQLPIDELVEVTKLK